MEDRHRDIDDVVAESRSLDWRFIAIETITLSIPGRGPGTPVGSPSIGVDQPGRRHGRAEQRSNSTRTLRAEGIDDRNIAGLILRDVGESPRIGYGDIRWRGVERSIAGAGRAGHRACAGGEKSQGQRPACGVHGMPRLLEINDGVGEFIATTAEVVGFIAMLTMFVGIPAVDLFIEGERTSSFQIVLSCS
ncbi:MAG: hypothetical protein IPF99_15775 [Deltaproteobacteria bacterium]|nr:hypothetical protein [Deltaproteobacteria bacterium]